MAEAVINQVENRKAFELAKEIFERLYQLYKLGYHHNEDIERHLEILKEYVNLDYVNSLDYNLRKNGVNLAFSKNGKQYTMHERFDDRMSFYMWVEDCAMMVYRLNGGNDQNIYSLTDMIRKELGFDN